jgi:type I restriction enzyme R subunit
VRKNPPNFFSLHVPSKRAESRLDEEELRKLWGAPDIRKKLLAGLADKGFGHEQLAEMQKIIEAEKSDLFDVLAYVAYALPPLKRAERA